METLCHTIEEIDRAARILMCVPTDNRDALIALGFERMYPQCASGYESHLWVRAIDAGGRYDATTGRKKLVMQRAYLDRPRRPRSA